MYADQQIFSPFKQLVIMMSIYVKQNCSIYNNHSIYCENPLNTQAISLKLLSPNSKTKNPIAILQPKPILGYGF